MDEEREEFCSILFNNLNLGQMVFIQAVVLPEIHAVLTKYAKDISDLEGEREE